MKITQYLTLLFAFLANSSIGQDYQMKTGEIILVDPDGRIIGSNTHSKYNSGKPSSPSNKESDYNDDGTPKIPGYKPTGNPSVDAENYKKAKFQLYQNQEKYKKWQEKFGQPPHHNHIKEIKHKEYAKMPPAKQQHVKNNPDKYKLVD